jgi:transcriptional regulator with XRE-family HTH domain
MNAGRMLREARARAGLTQRELAAATHVPQPAIARLEAGAVVPRLDTLDRLLAGCGLTIAAVHRPGAGIDRTPIRALLLLRPVERVRLAVREARNLERLGAATR